MKTRLFVVLLLAVLITVVTASVPPMINYQGKLMLPSGAPIADGTYSMKFAIYDVPTGGNALWSETNPSVQIKGGLFAVMLGSVTNLPANIFDSPDRFFAVKVGDESEMNPRQKIASVAYAQVAGTVSDGAITSAKIANDASIAMSKTALGTYIPWQTWTPAFYKSDKTSLNSATLMSTRYTQIGKTVMCSIIVLGIGAPGGSQGFFSPPVAARTENHPRILGCGYLSDGSYAGHVGKVGVFVGDRMRIYYESDSVSTLVGNTELNVTFIYEAE